MPYRQETIEVNGFIFEVELVFIDSIDDTKGIYEYITAFDSTNTHIISVVDTEQNNLFLADNINDSHRDMLTNYFESNDMCDLYY